MLSKIKEFLIEFLHRLKLHHEKELIERKDYEKQRQEAAELFELLKQKLPEDQQQLLIRYQDTLMGILLISEFFYYCKGIEDAKSFTDAILTICAGEVPIEQIINREMSKNEV